METSKLYETIFKRRSIRRYSPTPMDVSTLDEISAYLRSLQPLDAQIKVEMMLTPGEEMKSILPKAPHYVAVFSETKDEYGVNVGFLRIF